MGMESCDKDNFVLWYDYVKVLCNKRVDLVWFYDGGLGWNVTEVGGIYGNLKTANASKLQKLSAKKCYCDMERW